MVREAAQRTIGQRPFPVQLMGGAALHLGNIAEMKTGEGKTLTSVLPVYLNALAGKGVHVVTTNDYLAKRDSENMGRIHRFLGLSVGVILAEMPPQVRRVQYFSDITYGTNNEFGFDYLRDNMAWNSADMVQRGHHYAIVDEADSILIDEARTPLIISGPAEQSARWYQEFARMAPLLKKDIHYEVDERKRTVGVTEDGVSFVEDQLGIDNLYEAANTPLVGYLNNALKVKELYHRDKDYIVRDGQVLIVDEFTGRVLVGRRYNEGMHQAIEAKEGVEVQAENQTLATITLQNYFRLYTKLAGMTGTAQTEAAELHQIYKLGVVPIPTNMPMVRNDQPDLIYKTEQAKFEAVADDIAEKHPRASRCWSAPRAWRSRSTCPSCWSSARCRTRCSTPSSTSARPRSSRRRATRARSRWPPTWRAAAPTSCWAATPSSSPTSRCASAGWTRSRRSRSTRRRGTRSSRSMKGQVAAEAEEVKEAGGLYVLGTERHESRRIDNQLRGRSGRQGDPGESRFYLSLGDELMRRFNGAAVESIMTRLKLPEDVPIEAGMVTKAIRSAQTQVEQQNFEIRKNVLKYDEVLNKQRTVIYDERRLVLAGENIKEQIENMFTDVVTAYVDGETADGYAEDWDLDKLWSALRTLYPVGIDKQEITGEAGDAPVDLTRDELLAAVLADARNAYAKREAEIDELLAVQGGMRELERQMLLQVMDRKWREHLYEMDYLKEGIGLRAMAQRDPLIEYQREGFDMFTAMLDGIKEETVSLLFHVQVQVVPAEPVPAAEPEPVTAPQTAVDEPRTRARAGAGSPRPPRPCPRCSGERRLRSCRTAARPRTAPPRVAARRATGTRARPPRRARRRATGPAPAAPAASTSSATVRRRRPVRSPRVIPAAGGCRSRPGRAARTGRRARARGRRCGTPPPPRRPRRAAGTAVAAAAATPPTCGGTPARRATAPACPDRGGWRAARAGACRRAPRRRAAGWCRPSAARPRVSIGGGTNGSGGWTTRRTTTARAPGRGS